MASRQVAAGVGQVSEPSALLAGAVVAAVFGALSGKKISGFEP
jgi:hypothetical protein